MHQAIASGGFLAHSLAAAQARPPDPSLPAVPREESAIFIATTAAADALRPDVAVTRSGRLALAGRPLALHVTDHAVTAADLWVCDETTAVVLGDLVTLPAPFFESACPRQWQDTLEHSAAFRACVGSDTTAAACADAWTRDVGEFLPREADRRRATQYAAYYVDFLRKGGGASPDCARK